MTQSQENESGDKNHLESGPKWSLLGPFFGYIKGPVKIYRVPRPGFGKICLKKSLRPLIFSEKNSTPPFFS